MHSDDPQQNEPLHDDPLQNDPLQNLGVRVHDGGGELRVWSANATAMELCLFDDIDINWVIETVAMVRDEHDVWVGGHPDLVVGKRYSIRVQGQDAPTNHFTPTRHLVDPYARGLVRTPEGGWRSYLQDDSFDWAGATKPGTTLDQTVIYEAHARGISKLNPAVPEELRGTYAGLADESAIAQLKDLGITAIELLPVHQFVSEQRLLNVGLANYWGYNTLNFFTPHAGYASQAAQFGGTAAVLREFKGMVKLLHEAGIEVILDVVFNHTAEEGPDGPTTSLRGIDNASYYRQMDDGGYIDVTGCGNTVNFSLPAAQRLVLDSLRYWANEVQVDGFRFDLATTLGRNGDVSFEPEHPLLQAIVDDPALQGVKLIAEPWDVGMGGWQVGNFPNGWSEWNDGYRNRMRDFWLTDVAKARKHGIASEGIGSMARRLAGSAHVFSQQRGPLASVNFVTAHDGFTLADLTTYNQKHNLANGENNRDGTDDNHSFNHGVEGPTARPDIVTSRRKAMRNLLGTLLLSAGIPMISAGDEFGRSQKGNNNAYCIDDELSWLQWEREEWQWDLWRVSQKLLRLRRENPALRPSRFGVSGEVTPSATEMAWYNADGEAMSIDDWDSPEERTLQYFASATPETEGPNSILLIVHGIEQEKIVTLPKHNSVGSYTLLWDSAVDETGPNNSPPGAEVRLAPASMLLFRVNPPVEPAEPVEPIEPIEPAEPGGSG